MKNELERLRRYYDFHRCEQQQASFEAGWNPLVDMKRVCEQLVRLDPVTLGTICDICDGMGS